MLKLKCSFLMLMVKLKLNELTVIIYELHHSLMKQKAKHRESARFAGCLILMVKLNYNIQAAYYRFFLSFQIA